MWDFFIQFKVVGQNFHFAEHSPSAGRCVNNVRTLLLECKILKQKCSGKRFINGQIWIRYLRFEILQILQAS